MTRRNHLLTLATLSLGVLAGGAVRAEDSVKIGVILPMTGPSASTGRQIDAAIKLWMAQSGGKAGGAAARRQQRHSGAQCGRHG